MRKYVAVTPSRSKNASDCSTAEVMLCAVATVQPELVGDFGTLMVWADRVRRLAADLSATPHATVADPGERMCLVCFFPHDDFANNIEELEVSLESAKEEG